MSEEKTTVTLKKNIKVKLDELCPKSLNYDDFIETLLDKEKKRR
jgi:hypothetical protein